MQEIFAANSVEYGDTALTIGYYWGSSPTSESPQETTLVRIPAPSTVDGKHLDGVVL